MCYPFKRISNIEVISNHDLLHLRGWANAPAPVQPLTTIHGLINRHYQERPSQIAITSSSKEITYEELGKQSAVVARRLQDHGIRPGGVVGFCVAKSVFSLVVLMAILRAGACYVPISTTCPEERVAIIIQKADVQLLVAESGVIERLSNQEGLQEHPMLTPSSLDKGEEPPSDWTYELDMDPAHVAYIMFTSGSTGSPKGVVQEHGAVSGGLQAVCQKFELDPSTRFLQFASFSFDASICEIFAPLVSGGCVCIPSEEERIEDLEKTMQILGVTDASLTPVVVASLCPVQLPALKNLYIGGEAPNAAIVNTWADKVQLCNVYGSTEAGVWDTVQLNLGRADNPRTIGRGIDVNCWIVDPKNAQRLQPIGVEGELLLQSPFLARGYLDDASESSKAFIAAPESISTLTEPYLSRCYRTGDMARFQPDGRIIFNGRHSGFVKIRGLRVELGEVETAMNSCLLGDGPSAVIVDNEYCTTELVAFVERSDEAAGSLADEIHPVLQRILPSYMIPSVFIPIQSMPLTDSKKIDRIRLRAYWEQLSLPELAALRPGGTSSQTWPLIDPRDWRAVELSNTVADLVDMKQPSGGQYLRGQDFPLSSIGLDSILITYLSAIIRRRWGESIRIEHLQQPGITICQVVKHWHRQESGEPEDWSHIHTPRDLLDDLDGMDVPIPMHSHATKAIFLTSVTGFLGSQILRALLEDPDVGRIIGLVRASNEAEARDKIRSCANLGKWWQDEYDARIEVWLGDLSQPRLGLDDQHWLDLTGRMRIDGIIHNGARVNWLDNFMMLKATNVDSTQNVLTAISTSQIPCPLTYVGGGYLPSPTDTQEQIADKLANACGYDQTKFLSRMMVEKYNRQLDQHHNPNFPRARIIQPGFIAGTRWEGVAHPDDFLWRFAYSILSLGSVSEDLRKTHLPVAGVEQIAALVASSILRTQGKETVDCHDGISVAALCEILSACTGRAINTVCHEDWLIALRIEVENDGLDHPFLPVLDWFEANIWQFIEAPPTKSAGTPFLDGRDTSAALEKSTEYLVSLGLLPMGRDGCSRSKDTNHTVPCFKRST